MSTFKLKFSHRPCQASTYRTENGQAGISKRKSVRTNKRSLKNHTSTVSENSGSDVNADVLGYFETERDTEELSRRILEGVVIHG